jgi:hypothetical protein
MIREANRRGNSQSTPPEGLDRLMRRFELAPDEVEDAGGGGCKAENDDADFHGRSSGKFGNSEDQS